MKELTKRVNVKPAMPVTSINPPIRGKVRGVTMKVADIRRCIMARAAVEEILPDGSTVVLTLANYNKDNAPVVEEVVETPEAEPVKEPVTHKRSNKKKNKRKAAAETVEEPVEQEAEPVAEEPPVEEPIDEVIIAEASEAQVFDDTDKVNGETILLNEDITVVPEDKSTVEE